MSHVPRSPSPSRWRAGTPRAVPGAGMLANAHQNVILCEVLVPGWVQETVSGSEDPAVTDEAGSAQQLLGTLPVKHHLPGREDRKH